MVTWAKLSVTWQKSFSKVVKTAFHVSTGNLWKKKFPEKSYKICFFLKLSNKFWHLGAFLSHSSHEKVISMCSEDECKKNWEYKFFLSLSYLQLIFPAPRLEIRGGGGRGGRQFSMYASCGTMGACKKSCKINTLFVVFGHWVIEWKFVFELWVEKKWQELKNAFNRSKKNGLRRDFFE